MKKLYRIQKNEEFKKIIFKKIRFKNNSFIIYLNKRKENHARFGISVSKKLGNAVVRNKVKRQVKSMIHEICDYYDYQNDCVIIVKTQYLENEYNINKISLENLLKTSKMK